MRRIACARYGAIVAGAGPNGLAAAITIARAGRSVLVLEANETVGGGARSTELTLPGFVHDLGSAIHPLGLGSPFFQLLPLTDFGLEWIHPPVPRAHPLDDGTAAMLGRPVEETAAELGPDAAAYRRLMAPIVAGWDRIGPAILGPARIRLARHPLALARFGLPALLPARLLAVGAGRDLGGRPLPRGGAQRLAGALAGHLRALGGEIVTGVPVTALADLPPARAILCDVTLRQLLRLAGDWLPAGYRSRLGRYRYGPGVFKVDWALDGPIPWRA